MERRSGVTVVETLVALALTLMVVGGLALLVLDTWSLVRFELERMTLARTLRDGEHFLRQEWSGLAPRRGDIQHLGANRITYRATRGLAVVCLVQANDLTIRHDRRYGIDTWLPGRHLLAVFAAGDTAAGTPARWVELPFHALGGGAACPDGTPGTRIASAFHPSSLAPHELRPGAPLRVSEMMEVRSYPSIGTFWLGVRSVPHGVIQPALGPLAPGGLALRFVDSAGLPALDRHTVSAIEVTLRVTTTHGVRRRLGDAPRRLRDSMTVIIATEHD